MDMKFKVGDYVEYVGNKDGVHMQKGCLGRRATIKEIYIFPDGDHRARLGEEHQDLGRAHFYNLKKVERQLTIQFGRESV